MAYYAILASNATSALDDATLNIIQNAFDSLKSTGIQIFGIALVAAVGIAVVVAGGTFALKWIKGILNKAA